MARKKKQEILEPIEPTKVEFETFQRIGSYQVNQLKMDEPSCFNGDVRVRKYRIAVELVDEPPEIVGARIQAMWDACENLHHWEPLKNAARKVGWTLKGEAGNKKKKSTEA